MEINLDEVIARINSLGIPAVYSHFTEGQAQEPPFICWLMPESRTSGADKQHSIKRSTIRIELYANERDFELENEILDLFEEFEIETESTFIESEALFFTVFEFEIIERI